MRRLLACLLACAVAGCGGAAAGPPDSDDLPAAPTPTSSPAPLPSAPTPPPTARPSLTASPSPEDVTAWTIRSVAVYPTASDDGPVQVHLGVNFPVKMTIKTKTVDGVLWCEASWQTLTRHEIGWLPADALTMFKPEGMPAAGIDALDADLGLYLAHIGARVGVQVTDVTRGVTYGYNGNIQYLVASSMKVPIMLAFLSQIEKVEREPTRHELALLTTMIENSNNQSAKELYVQIGDRRGIDTFMREVGIGGLKPAPVANGSGYSAMTPATMVALLVRLHDGSILTEAHRALALNLMQHGSPNERIGVGDSSPAGAAIAMAIGWVQIHDGSGTYLMNSSGIVTLGKETYVISVYTDRNATLGGGYSIVRHVCKVIGQRLEVEP